MRSIPSLAELLLPRWPGRDPLGIERQTILPLGKKFARQREEQTGRHVIQESNRGSAPGSRAVKRAGGGIVPR